MDRHTRHEGQRTVFGLASALGCGRVIFRAVLAMAVCTQRAIGRYRLFSNRADYETTWEDCLSSALFRSSAYGKRRFNQGSSSGVKHVE